MGVVGCVRYALGSVMMVGVAPEYLGVWLVWRGMSLALPPWVYQWGDDKLYSLYQRLVLFFFETCTRVEVVMYGDADEALKKKESVLYLANHQSTVDWLVADMVALRGGSLGHLRYVMKDTLQLMPLYGHYFYAHGCIYVKRGNFNQRKMIASLDYLRNPNIPTWLIIFPEGTRYYPGTPKVIQSSEQFARDHNLQIECKRNTDTSDVGGRAGQGAAVQSLVLKHHLVPKVKGTWLVTKHLHDKFDALYDVSVFYEGTVDQSGVRGNAPQLIEFLLGKCKRVHIHIRRIPMTEVPQEEESLRVWLHGLYAEKDKLAENFFSKDATQRATVQKTLGGRVSHLGLWSTLSSFIFFTALSVPFLCTKMGHQLYLHLLMYGTMGSYAWLAIRSVC
ncbi:1-acyl-sn-glycerol-3-phosphate acyltransferase epsilon-like isoform X2 [Portunus trituberculatus]|uniref:1-acyl-sn-glycerol-3-phosphate acyltransferase epsilon-like isoform X2 n=1 Tax=Portunus trituberculatus TaxID=210409 RepID=UPI001E1CDFC8|nr:1-acyl-sn-glycerol-3-phosphate acyltransferase epsilon-like isoform X2 [Portunus trituberculatus]